MVHGENPLADVLLAVLNLKREQVPRYRDCYWTGTEIAVHTRTGGGNRAFYESPESRLLETDASEKDGPFNRDLRALPTFVRDEDDAFDPTYATFYFKVPEHMLWVTPQLQADVPPAEKWALVMEKLKVGVDDPQVARVTAALEPILKKIDKLLDL